MPFRTIRESVYEKVPLVYQEHVMTVDHRGRT